MHKLSLLALPLLLAAPLAAQADPPQSPPDFGDRVEHRLDKRGDRIDSRLRGNDD